MVSGRCARKGWGGREDGSDGGQSIRLYGIYHTSTKTRLISILAHYMVQVVVKYGLLIIVA